MSLLLSVSTSGINAWRSSLNSSDGVKFWNPYNELPTCCADNSSVHLLKILIFEHFRVSCLNQRSPATRGGKAGGREGWSTRLGCPTFFPLDIATKYQVMFLHVSSEYLQNGSTSLSWSYQKPMTKRCGYDVKRAIMYEGAWNCVTPYDKEETLRAKDKIRNHVLIEFRLIIIV